MNKLRFGKSNAKLGEAIHTFSLPAGWTCPGAKECLAKADRETGKLKDGKEATLRCFAATMESRMPSVRKSRWHNFDLLKGLNEDQMVELIQHSLPKAMRLLRVDVGGDIYNENLFRAWMRVARANPGIIFYAYTKSLELWVSNRHFVPPNFKLTASKGGTHDHLIGEYGLKYAEVVFTPEQATKLGLEIDHDDSHAYGSDKSFALLLHGTQARGTLAAKALSVLKARGFKGYSEAKAA